MLLTLTWAGAGIGQWVWLTQKWPFAIGLLCYVVALTAWLELTGVFVSLPDRKKSFAWMASIIFGGLALLVGLNAPGHARVALLLAAIALGYAAWAVGQSQFWTATRRKLSQPWTARDRLCSSLHALNHEVKAHPARTVLAGGSFLIVAGAGLAAHRGLRPNTHLVSLGAWGLGLTLFGLAFAPSDAPGRLVTWLRGLGTDHRLETTVVIATWGLAIALRAINLKEIPWILTGDEGAMGLEAVRVLQGQQVNPFSTGWMSHPTLYFYVQALFLRLLGQSIPALRLTSALAGAFTVPITYLFARRSLGATVARISALFMAGYHVHIHYSRLALNNIWAPLAAVLTLLCLWQGLQSRQSWLCALGGIAMGLGQYTYFGARLLPLVVIAWLLYLCFIPKSASMGMLSGNGKRVVVFWLAFLLTILPLGWFFLEHWHAFTTRVQRVGILGSEGINPTGSGLFISLATSLFDSLMAFNYVRDRSIFYGPPLPLLHWLSGIAFVLGISQAIVRRRDPAHGLLLIWLLGTILFGGMLVNYPPKSPRLLFAAPAVAILVALGLTQVESWVTRRGQKLTLIAALVATGISAFYYLGIYTPSKQFGDPRTQLAHRLGIWARELEPDHDVYFFGAPHITRVGFPSITFLAPEAHIQDVFEPIERPLPVKHDTTFIYSPRRLGELDIIAAAYPDGRRWEMLDERGQLLYSAYEVRPKP